MRINVHAGHNKAGKVACGAVGILNESNEARAVKNEVIRLLTLLGHTVYDCTVDDAKSQADNLSKIVAKCNSHDVDVDLSIHFNAGANDQVGNGKTTGTEVYIYPNGGMHGKAQNVVNSIAALGFKNRGVKTSKDLYVLRKTKAPAMLVECCFVDDADDARLYDAYSMASAIVYGLTGQRYTEPVAATDSEAAQNGAETTQGAADTIYRVQVGAFKNKANAEKLVADLKKSGFSAYITK
jgi:N-acetylmuramoyl-L-alanine amidase